MLELSVVLLLGLLGLAYYFFTSTFNHWKNKGVPYRKPYPIFGSKYSVITLKQHAELYEEFYYQFDGEKYAGFFQGRTPALLIRDVETAKRIMTKDFSHFMNHGIKVSKDDAPLVANNVFILEGRMWKEMRAKLSPTFTSGKLKFMFPMFLECSKRLEKHLGKLVEAGQDIDCKLTETEVIAQALAFFVAGFETSSTTLTNGCFELARQPEVQRKAREHIEEVLQRHGGKLTYQALQEMKTLRKYPPATMIMRECNKNYVMPETNLHINKGTRIIIPAKTIHNDPLYFSEPERFYPERFSKENDTTNSNQLIYMPFGEGPRQCIAIRFAYMQTKMGLLMALRHYELYPSPRTMYPLKRTPKQFQHKISDVFVRARKL